MNHTDPRPDELKGAGYEIVIGALSVLSEVWGFPEASTIPRVLLVRARRIA